MNGTFRIADWLVERNLNRLSKGGRSIQIEPKAMEVLVHLAAHPGEVLSRTSIVKAVWSETHVCDEVLTYCVFELRKAFEDDAKHPRIIETIPRRGYRLIAPVSKPAEAPVVAPERRSPAPRRTRRLFYWGSAATCAAVLLILSIWYQPWSPALGESDFILLTDFENSTGDTVFDGTLKHALAMHLSQTPFFNVFPEEWVRETLRYMGRSPDERVSLQIGREICERRGIKAMLSGSIANLGRSFVISLEAINGQTGEVIAREQVQAESHELVLRELGKAATRLRQRLGESINSIERFDVPLEQATTRSLTAFKAYSMGRRNLISGLMAEAIPHYERALEFDSNFASAYDDLAWCYFAVSDRQKAAECARKAYALRDRVSEYERLSISSIYYTMATSELGKAVETLEMMRTIYPRSAPVHNTLGELYLQTGQLEKAEPAFREAIRLTRHPNAYGGLADTCFRLNRAKEAKDVIAEARRQGIDNRELRRLLYLIAFGEGDRATMVQQAQWALGKQEEAFMLALQGNAAAYAGRLEEAREFFRQAISIAQRRELENAAADFAAGAAIWEACSGNCDRALEYVSSSLSSGAESRNMLRSALILALCAKPDEAEDLVDRIDAEYPTDTALQQVSLPVVRAAIALDRGEPFAALKALGMTSQKTAPTALWPRYVAAEAYRRLGSHSEAQTENHYVLKHRCMEALSPLCALARLGLARSGAASGNNAGSGKTYQELFAHWNHADPDIPIFRQAIAEYSSQRRAQP